jgi:hypothetical protein
LSLVGGEVLGAGLGDEVADGLAVLGETIQGSAGRPGL